MAELMCTTVQITTKITATMCDLHRNCVCPTALGPMPNNIATALIITPKYNLYYLDSPATASSICREF